MKHKEKEMGFAKVVPVIHNAIKSENLYDMNSPKNKAAKEMTSWRKPFFNPLKAYQQRGISTMMSIQFVFCNG